MKWLLISFALSVGAPAEPLAFADVHRLLQTHCASCHSGKAAAGGFNLAQYPTEKSLMERPKAWNRVLARVLENEMPPPSAKALAMPDRERLVGWLSTTLHTAACADGITPPAFPVRRLNRSEYTATVRDLLNIPVNAGRNLPVDGAGGEGFDNAAETLFISPIHAEKYLEAARIGIEYGLKDPKSRAVFLPAVNDGRKALTAFLPRAFRRPVRPAEIEKYVALFDAATKRGDDYDTAIGYALQAVLLSPHFLLRLETAKQDYALASRLSYFLWGSMPDAELFKVAGEGKLYDPVVLTGQVMRMLRDQKSREMAENFTGQWLNLRELGRDIKPDAKLSPEYYDAEIGSAIGYEPALFLHDLLQQNDSLLNLIDSPFTIVTDKLAKFYGLPRAGLRQQPKRVPLPAEAHRGGLLGMSAVLAVTSYPTRTSPVLRGKWILDAMLGTPPPPPPPNVPALKEHDGATPQTLRERLLLHRANAVCAGCHKRMDPLGFGLENYDMLGRWRTTDAGQPIDASGELPDGSKFDGPRELKAMLMARKGLFLRNLTAKMLGFALGRGLTAEDQCAVDQIAATVEREGYHADTLVLEIVRSIPFQKPVKTQETTR